MRSLACGEITPGEAATIAGVYETFVRTAGTAREKVAQGNSRQILTAGDDVEDKNIGDPKPSTVQTRRRRGSTAAGEPTRRRVAIQPGGKIFLQIFCRCRRRKSR